MKYLYGLFFLILNFGYSDNVIENNDKFFFVIIGPQASGKMTVGQELSKITNLKLFHNHMILEQLLSIFDFDDPNLNNLLRSIRLLVFDTIAKSSFRGVIFTFNWNFNNDNSLNSMNLWTKSFKNIGAKIYVVELISDLKTRLKRNKSKNRLQNKPIFKDINKSEKILLECQEKWKMHSDINFQYGDKFLRIDNNNKSAKEVAEEIKIFFKI
jgi:hypothetical protein